MDQWALTALRAKPGLVVAAGETVGAGVGFVVGLEAVPELSLIHI